MNKCDQEVIEKYLVNTNEDLSVTLNIQNMPVEIDDYMFMNIEESSSAGSINKIQNQKSKNKTENTIETEK